MMVWVRENPRRSAADFCGSACGPVIVPVFKTGGRQVTLSLVGSTPTRFRHLAVQMRASELSHLISREIIHRHRILEK
jgi:hypothetical protein